MPTATLATFVTDRSADEVTASASAAEQTPATVHDGDGLELTTPAGGVIETVFVTPVWASAVPDATTRSSKTSARATKAAA